MAKAAAVPLAPGVWRIPLIGDYVNGFMLRDDDGQVTLIDMGVGVLGREGDGRPAVDRVRTRAT